MRKSIRQHAPAGAAPMAVSLTKGGLLIPAHAAGHWGITVHDPDGVLIAERQWENLVTIEGKNYLLGAGLLGGAVITTWYLMLISGTPTVAEGDTLASHAGWTEVTAYSESARQGWTGAAASGGSTTNAATVASFTIDTDGTVIGGGALVSDSTKGGAAGSMYAAGAFTGGNLTLSAGSTADVTAAFSL